MFQTNKIYNWLIIALISLGALGDIFSPFTLQRIFCVILFPLAVIQYAKYYKSIPFYIGLFFVIWFGFSIFSIAWTPDRSSGLKSIAYNFCSIAIYLEVILFSIKAKNPVKSILLGWTLLFALTLPVAFWEIFTNQHLPTNINENISIMSITGKRIWMIYASATFDNYNNYVLIILYCMPFILASIAYFRRVKIWYWMLLVGAMFVLLINSSRGGIACSCIMFAVMLWYFTKNKMINRFAFILIIAAICGLAVYYFDFLFNQVVGRFTFTNVFEDDLRKDTYERGLRIFIDTFGIGCGIGGLQLSLEKLSANGISAMHNMFLEFLVQYGIIPFIAFIVVLFRSIKSLLKSEYSISKFIGVIMILVIIPMSVINSTYLLDQIFWAFWASLFVFGHVSETYDSDLIDARLSA